MRNKLKGFIKGQGVTAYAFGKRTGLSSTTAYGLVNDPTKIPSGVVLGAICETFKVQPNEFLEWVEEGTNDE